jgi:Peptidoglycan-binding protein, CsiV
VRPLPASAFQLDSIAARLRSSGRYLPVAHVAWSQTASPWGHPIQIPVQSLGVDSQGLSGTVSLQRGQYLHLGLSLDYAMDEPPSGLRAPPGTVFSLHEVHRVRFYERNYFDHPAFGVIALVTPLQESRHAGR